MNTVNSIQALREQVLGWKKAGERVALIPTMGNLHDGHLELVRRAQGVADRTVVSIFVNPLQFGEGEDFGSYPRTLEADSDKLAGINTDLVFAPTVKEMYPKPQSEQTRVEVPLISDILCGESRPGHFVGVATVVCKLINMALPDVAVFGEKDFQQLMVIRRMAEDLCLPVEIMGVSTVREADGLARSSRNGYLTREERAIAPALYRVLQQTAESIRSGKRDYATLEAQANQTLKETGLTPDYFKIRRAADLTEPLDGDQQLVMLAAAYLGKARLIDNMTLDLA
ncbi:MAG: pantoate--beta-alanine ligase [Chromatiales bacterium]|nr:pantoate--beta-alanine ligase [Chromatiales bacterium]